MSTLRTEKIWIFSPFDYRFNFKRSKKSLWLFLADRRNKTPPLFVITALTEPPERGATALFNPRKFPPPSPSRHYPIGSDGLGITRDIYNTAQFFEWWMRDRIKIDDIMILLFMPFHALSLADIFNIFQLNFKYLTGDQILKTFLIFLCSIGFYL